MTYIQFPPPKRTQTGEIEGRLPAVTPGVAPNVSGPCGSRRVTVVRLIVRSAADDRNAHRAEVAGR